MALPAAAALSSSAPTDSVLLPVAEASVSPRSMEEPAGGATDGAGDGEGVGEGEAAIGCCAGCAIGAGAGWATGAAPVPGAG